MGLLISGATIIDGVGDRPREGECILVTGRRIEGIGRRETLDVPADTTEIDGRGKFVIPGLMNANVHLLNDIRLENLARHYGSFTDLIVESAQVALAGGITTVFDTWGPRRFLIEARERIDRGEAPGSRIFCAGNIVGFDGPFSPDFYENALSIASGDFARRINSIWVENVGRHLMWLPPDKVAEEIKAYLGKGIDFIKYASNDHFPSGAGQFLAFSPAVQAAIVEEAHRAGVTAQAHTMTVEGLRIAVEAGCDLIQHANITGPVEIPDSTLELMAQRKTGAVVFPWTEKGLQWLLDCLADKGRTLWLASDENVRKLIRSGVPLLMANDGHVMAPEANSDAVASKSWSSAPEDQNLGELATGHFVWFLAMEEKGCPPMEMLKAATRNIAAAYGKERDLGSLEPGKLADLLILNENPLEAAKNYRSIHMIVKDGSTIDRAALPTRRYLTLPMADPEAEEASYVPAIKTKAAFPSCPACIGAILRGSSGETAG